MRCGDPDNPNGPYIKKNGRPCNMPVITGTFRCMHHGGNTPVAKSLAQQALALLRVPAIEGLADALYVAHRVVDQFSEDACPHCHSVRVTNKPEFITLITAVRHLATIATKILDRTGLGPRIGIDVKQSDGDLDLAALLPGEKSEFLRIFGEYNDLKERLRNRLAGIPESAPVQSANFT